MGNLKSNQKSFKRIFRNKITESAQSKTHVNMTTENVITPQTDSSKRNRRSQLKNFFNSSLAKHPIAEKQPNEEKKTITIIGDSN